MTRYTIRVLADRKRSRNFTLTSHEPLEDIAKRLQTYLRNDMAPGQRPGSPSKEQL